MAKPRIPKKFHKAKPQYVKCWACNGSGHYDHNNSPRCSACNGTGLEKQ